MSKVPSLKDILNEIPDEISDEEDGYEEIEYDGSQRSVISKNSFKDLPKKKFLDIPDEYTQLKPIRNIEEFSSGSKNGVPVQKTNRNAVKPVALLTLTEQNIAKVNNESLISYDIPLEDSIETKSKRSRYTERDDLKSHRSHRSHVSHESRESHKSVKSHKSHKSNIDFSVGVDPNSHPVREEDVRSVSSSRSALSSISALSMGSIKPVKHGTHEKSKKSRETSSHISMSTFSTPSFSSLNEDQKVAAPLKKSSSVSSLGSKVKDEKKRDMDERTVRSASKQLIPLSSSIYPKQSPNIHGFDKFSNQKKEDEKPKVDLRKIKNIEEFKEKVQRYIGLDDEIITLSLALRERKKEKQRFEGEILEFMKENEIESIKNKQDSSIIEVFQKKRTETLSKEYLTETLIELLKNKSTAENITNYIYEKRGIIEKSMIKRMKEKGKR